MRPSRVLSRLRNGQVASCLKLNLADVRSAEIAARAGFDCLWADLEHVPNDLSSVEHQILAAKAYDVDMIVRISRGGYSDYIRPLEMDAAGIMVPHLMSLEDARNVVRMTRFHPVGRRPIDGGCADGAYTGLDLLQYIEQANRERFVAVQVEDPEVLDDLDAIAALEGIDMLFFGPGDFSQGIGAPAQWDHPLIIETRRRVAQVCLEHGKYAGTVGAPAQIPELVEMGYRFLSVGADVVGLREYCAGLAAAFQQQTAVVNTTSIYGGR